VVRAIGAGVARSGMVTVVAIPSKTAGHVGDRRHGCSLSGRGIDASKVLMKGLGRTLHVVVASSALLSTRALSIGHQPWPPPRAVQAPPQLRLVGSGDMMAVDWPTCGQDGGTIHPFARVNSGRWIGCRWTGLDQVYPFAS
jgi:hypothetical protein